jgi:demethylmenaquinone methyltransferase/2-methoxy-6-polyprenyl-1,4-benzoquinol methylase
MTTQDKQRSQYVHDMFARIAPHYDLMNRLMTGRQDVRWRKEVIQRAHLKPGACVLDVGAGTGDLLREAKRQQPDVRVYAADFTLEMMRIGQQRGGSGWSAADALCLPFADETFDATVSGFLVRNVTNVEDTLREQFRVLKKGGRIIILDTTPPGRNLFTPLIWVHMHWIIPLLGGLLSGSREAYIYLPDSSEKFLSADELAVCMTAAGFQEVGFRKRMFGTIAIHWGRK